MMRFDLTCNIALRVEPRRRLRARVLPSLTAQQQLLHEVIWVEGCERWMVSAGPDGARDLELLGCENEVRVAFASSLNVAPAWRHVAALWEQRADGPSPPRASLQFDEQWSAERIVAALGPTLRTASAVFAALPELFEWIRRCIDANGLPRYARVPAEGTTRSAERTFEPLQFAIAVFRSLGMPARIVTGFAPGPVQRSTHDARTFNIELFRDGRWWLFEPDGQVPAFGFVRTAVGYGMTDLPLLQGAVWGHPLRMDVDVDPPPAWGVPLRTSSRLLLSLDAQHRSGADTPSAPRAAETPTSA